MPIIDLGLTFCVLLVDPPMELPRSGPEVGWPTVSEDAFVAEIRLTEEGVIPVFRVPGPGTPIPDRDPSEAGQTTPTGDPVRAMGRSVGRQGLEP